MKSRLLFYVLALFGSIALFSSFGFLSVDCVVERGSGKSCTTVGFNDGLKGNCTWNDFPLHGKVQFVESFSDIKVKLVESFSGISN